MGRTIEINGRLIGKGYPTYIVAEMSANHNGDLERAIKIVEAAKDAGADAIKIQTYTPDTMTIKSDREQFQIKGTLWEGKNLYDLYREAYTPWDWQPQLNKVASDLGIDFFSTPFDISSVNFLEEMGVPAYKVASFELVDIPLLERISKTLKPIIISTGMATLGEIDEAVRSIASHGNTEMALLKCTSAYPAPPEGMNLRTIPHLADAFDLPVGLSDHTLGAQVPIVGVALGACIVEKHFTLSRNDPGPDSAFSMEPDEFKAMVNDIRMAEKAMGRISYGVTDSERDNRVFRRSLYVVANMDAGQEFTEENVKSIRPGYGLHPRHRTEILGRKAKEEITKGTPLSWRLIR